MFALSGPFVWKHYNLNLQLTTKASARNDRGDSNGVVVMKGFK